MTRHATVVGSGPNGLSAALALAYAGYRVRVLESGPAIGGSAATADGPLPGFRHDVGSAVHPLALTSPFLRAWGIDRRVSWAIPEASFAHPLDDGPAAIAWRNLDRTVEELGAGGQAWRRIVVPWRDRLDALLATLQLGPLAPVRHPVTFGRFSATTGLLGSTALPLAVSDPRTQALWAGVAAHAPTRVLTPPAAGAGLLLAAHAHTATGWPVPLGGAGSITTAMAEDLRAHGGVIETDTRVDLATLDWGDPDRGDVLVHSGSPLDLLGRSDLPTGYRRALRRYRYGPALAKVDFALSGPVPWRSPDVAASPTVHLGGSLGEIAASADAVARGRISDRPYVLAAQATTVDSSRAPKGSATLWAYLRVPLGSAFDPTEHVLRQLERFAPGTRDLVIGHTVTTARQLAARNPAAIGGDGLAGALTIAQAVSRPTLSATPWRTPLRGIYLAGAATTPGPSVHGMAGWNAARTVLADADGSAPDLAALFAAHGARPSGRMGG